MATRRTVISGTRSTVTSGARKGFAIDGLPELQASLAGMIDAMSAKEVKQVARGGGEIVADVIKREAPYDPNRKEGIHLRDAIFVGGGKQDKPDVLVGVNLRKAPHGLLVEFGTTKKQPNPFFRRGVAQSGNAAAEHIERGLIQIIDQAAKK
jgi:HK97 gp10 family phage protein